MIDVNKTAEAAYDRLDDQGQLNAAEIREAVGWQADDIDFSALAKTQVAEELDPSNQKGGIFTKRWQESFADPEQAKRNKAGIEAGKAALRPART